MLTELGRWPSEQSVWCSCVRVIVQTPACTPGECKSPPAFKAYGRQREERTSSSRLSVGFASVLSAESN